MSSLPNLVLTNAGATLLAKSPIGSPIPVTKWQIGTGVLPDGTNLRTRTKLVSVYTDVDIARVENDGNECVVTGNFVNKGYGAFTWTETGLFAQDPDVGEILYAYGNAGSDGGVPIPAGTTQYREVEFGVQLVFDVAANVTSTVSQSMIYATRADLKTKADLVGGQVPYTQIPHLTRNMNLYVDSVSGADTNTGTQEKPFRTVQAAVDSLPRDLGGYWVGVVVVSDIVDEDVVNISGFYNGRLLIRAASTTLLARCSAGFYVSFCDAVVLQGIHFCNAYGVPTQEAWVIARHSNLVKINSCTVDGQGKTKDGVQFHEQINGHIHSTTFNQCNRAIVVTGTDSEKGLATLSVYDCTGTGNGIALRCSASICAEHFRPIENIGADVSVEKTLGGILFRQDGTLYTG